MKPSRIVLFLFLFFLFFIFFYLLIILIFVLFKVAFCLPNAKFEYAKSKMRIKNELLNKVGSGDVCDAYVMEFL